MPVAPKTIIRNIFFVILGIGLVWWQLARMTNEEAQALITSIKGTNVFIIILVTLINVSSHFVRGVRWTMLLKPLGYMPRAETATASFLIGNSANNFLPRVGEILRCTLLSKKENYKLDRVIGTVVVERIVDGISFLLFIVLTLLMQATTISNSIKEKLPTFSHLNWGNLIGIGIVGFAVIAGIIYVLKKSHQKNPENVFLRKVNTILNHLWEGLTTMKKVKPKGLFIGLTIIMWALYLLQMYVGFFAIPSTAHLGIKEAFAVLTLASLALTITPGGMGTFPLFVMQGLLMFHVPKSSAITFGWFMWSISVLINILTGFIAFVLFPYFKKGKNTENVHIADEITSTLTTHNF